MSRSRGGRTEGVGRQAAAPGRCVGDVERDATVSRLTEASTRGELDADEFDERLGAALRATYYDELEVLTADLGAPSTDSRDGV